MDSTAENVGKVVAILTAILSEQEQIAYELVLESDPIELFSCMTGILLSTLLRLSEINDCTIQQYLQEIGMNAFRNS